MIQMNHSNTFSVNVNREIRSMKSTTISKVHWKYHSLQTTYKGSVNTINLRVAVPKAVYSVDLDFLCLSLYVSRQFFLTILLDYSNAPSKIKLTVNILVTAFGCTKQQSHIFRGINVLIFVHVFVI